MRLTETWYAAYLVTTSASNLEGDQEPTTWLSQLQHSFRALSSFLDATPRSHTVVFEAVAFLIQQGMLNVKHSHHVNVKQARAVLHWAWWLQQRLSRQWVNKGDLAAPPWEDCPRPLRPAIIGGAGTAKTSTVKIIEALRTSRKASA